jgi:hypothetical protein
MSETAKPTYLIIGMNLLIMAIYFLLSFLSGGKNYLLGASLFSFVQVFICIVAGIVCIAQKKYQKLAGQWFLSSLVILLIGFSTCCYTFKL